LHADVVFHYLFYVFEIFTVYAFPLLFDYTPSSQRSARFSTGGIMSGSPHTCSTPEAYYTAGIGHM